MAVALKPGIFETSLVRRTRRIDAVCSAHDEEPALGRHAGGEAVHVG